MSHFECRCGYDIRDITCPSTHDARLVTDMEQDDWICNPQSKEPYYPDPMNSRDVMECPECHRIWIQHSPRSPNYIPFVPEDGKGSLGLAEQQGGYRG